MEGRRIATTDKGVAGYIDSTFMQAVRVRTDAAIASGALQPIVAKEAVVDDGGLPFIVRWIAALAAKDAVSSASAPSTGAGRQSSAPASSAEASQPSSAATTLPGGPRDPNFNPFLSPEPALTVGPVGAHHNAILNKFPVCLLHLVLARRAFAEQQSPLERIDFQALASVMVQAGGLGFYNGGAAAGASQRHKHLQWIPADAGNASLRHLIPGLPADVAPGGVARHPVLVLQHCFVRLMPAGDQDVDGLADAMLQAFGLACETLGLAPDADGLLPPCNMLINSGWMLLIPRSREHFQGVSLNALSYGGTIYVRDPAQFESIRQAGPLRVLQDVGMPWGTP